MRYKVIAVVTFLFSISSVVFGQQLLPVMYDSTLAQQQLIVNGGLTQHSTAFANELTRKFVFGGEISRDLSTKVYEKQADYNRIGGGINGSIQYRASDQIFESKPNWSWMINVANELHFSGEYSDDLFGLVFLGNESFLGENVPFAGTSMRYERYLSVGGGIHDRKSKSYITLNAILPQDFIEMSVHRGGVKFSESGDQITLNAEAEMLTANNYAYFKGLGAALNFEFNVPFTFSPTFNGIINITGRNIGGYQLYNGDQVELNTSQDYSGFSIADMIEEEVFQPLLDSLNVEESVVSRFKMLPGFLQVGKVVKADALTKVQSFFGVRMYTNRVYRPMLYVGVHYQPITQFSIGAQGSFGGYGNLRLGFYANYSTDNLVIGLGTEDLLGAILKTQYGHSGLIRLAWKF